MGVWARLRGGEQQHVKDLVRHEEGVDGGVDLEAGAEGEEKGVEEEGGMGEAKEEEDGGTEEEEEPFR